VGFSGVVASGGGGSSGSDARLGAGHCSSCDGRSRPGFLRHMGSFDLARLRSAAGLLKSWPLPAKIAKTMYEADKRGKTCSEFPLFAIFN